MQADVETCEPIGNLDSTPVMSDADKKQLWTRIKKRLRAELGEDVFVSWFARLELESIDNQRCVLSVPTRFLKNWIEAHYSTRVKEVFSTELSPSPRIELFVRSSSMHTKQGDEASIHKAETFQELNGNVKVTTAKTGEETQSELYEERFMKESSLLVDRKTQNSEYIFSCYSGSPLEHRYTFDNFISGASNSLARAASERIAFYQGEGVLYNPFYMHAGVGLGKTHLLHSVGHAASNLGKRVIYLTADRFMYSFVNALKTQSAMVFKEQLRSIDLLIIDDIQFIQGKAIQLEFGHTLNALIDSNKQVVIASDRPPLELESMDERIRSRLAGGLVIEIGPLDEKLRVLILESRVALLQKTNPGFLVSGNVIEYIAKSITSNGRDLEGAVNRLLAHATLTGHAVTMAIAEKAVRDLIKNKEPRWIKIEDIQKLVANRYNVSRSDIISERRTAAIVKPRQIAMYLSKVLTLRSLPEIGRRFGGRDHTTVLHAVRKIDKLIAQDDTLNDEVELLKKILQD